MDMRALGCAMVGLWIGLHAGTAHADAPRSGAQGDDWDGGYDIRAERRSGFMGASTLALGPIAARGYPNEVEKLGKDQYRSSTGPSLGMLETHWLGGALRDWFAFGLGIYGIRSLTGSVKASSGGFLFHVEAFPLFTLGGRYRDLALYTNVGLGSLTISGGPEKADGGLMSFMSLGAHFEILKLRFFALGPALEGMYSYSQYARGGGASLGLRAALYTGP